MLSYATTTTLPRRPPNVSSPPPDSTRSKAGGLKSAARLEVPGGDLHQNGGLDGRVLDLDEARAAVAAVANGGGVTMAGLSGPTAPEAAQWTRVATAAELVAATQDVTPAIEIDGDLDRLEVAGGIHAEGRRSDAVHVRDDMPDLSGVDITAVAGHPIVRLS